MKKEEKKKMENKISKLVEHRRLIKKRKPKFIRQDFHKISSLGKGRKKKQKWRCAKGRHSKVRQSHKGRRAMPTIGYRSPKLVRGMIEGKKPIFVHNVHDLKKIGKENIGIVASVGLRKKIEILNKAKELKIHILNLNEKSIDEQIKKREEEKKLEKKKEESKKKVEVAKDQEKIKEKEREHEEAEEKKLITQPVEEIKHEEHIKIKEKKLVKRVALEK